MRGTVIRLSSISARQSASAANQPMSIGEWRTFCEEVREACEQLLQIAARAETAALNADAESVDPLRSLARDFDIPSPPAAPHKARTYATLMLGPFAALEELRRRIWS